MEKGKTKKEKKEKEHETKETKRMPRTGRKGKGAIGAGKNSCAGPEITRKALFRNKTLSLPKGWKTFKCEVYNSQHRGVRFFAF